MATGYSAAVVNKYGGAAAFEKNATEAQKQEARAASAGSAATLNGGSSSVSAANAKIISDVAARAPAGYVLNPAYAAWLNDPHPQAGAGPAYYIQKVATPVQTQKVSAAIVANSKAAVNTTVKSVAKTPAKTTTPAKTAAKTSTTAAKTTTTAKVTTPVKTVTAAAKAVAATKAVTGITTVGKAIAPTAKATIQQQIAKNSATVITNKATVVPANTAKVTQAAKITTGSSALSKYNRVTQAASPAKSASLVSLATARDSTRVSSRAEDNYGKVQLQNGEYVDQVQQTGAKNPYSGRATIIATKPTPESLVKVGDVYKSLVSSGKKKAGKATVGLEDTNKGIPTSAQVSRTGVTTSNYQSKIAAEQKASFEANEKAKAALGGGVLVDRAGNAINQISGKGVNELGQLVTISTPVTVNGKLSSYTRGAGQAAKDVQDYYTNAAQKLGLSGVNLTSRANELARAASTAPVVMDVKAAFKAADIKASDEKATKQLDTYKQQHPGAVSSAIATGYYYSRDLSALAQGLDKSNQIAASKLSFLPSGEKLRPTIQAAISANPFAQSVNAVSKGLNLTGNKQVKQAVSNINAVKKGTVDFTVEQYDEARTKPVSYAGEIGLMYAAGGAFGAGTQAGKFGLSTGLVKAGEKLGAAGVPLAASAGRFAGRSLPLGADLGMGGALAYQVGSQVVSAGSVAGGTKAALVAGKELAIGGVGFKRGSELVSGSRAFAGVKESYKQIEPYKASDLSPKITKARISQLVGEGSNTEPIDLIYGRSFNLGNRPIITHVKGEGLKLGAGAAPESILSGKVTQSFAKAENPFFKATVKTRGGAVESKYLNSAMNIAERVYSTRKPLYTPERFEITSSAIPEAQRSAITSAIKTYKGELKVAGSVPMKAQANPFVTRTPHDLELYGDSVDSVITHVASSLKKSGFKEGKDFRRGVDEKGKKTNQVEFRSGENWDAGIEVFDHATLQSDIPKAIAKNKSPIAFGYSEKAPVLVGNKAEGWIKTQDLSEQVTRKVAGSTFFKDSTVQPAHPGRVKDIGDVVTTATAFAVKGKLPIDKDVISFVNSSVKKFGGNAEFPKFDKNVATDPVFKFIYENQRLPTLKEVPEIGKIAVSDKVLLYESKAAAATVKPAKTGNPIIDAAINKGQARNGLVKEPAGADIFTRKTEPGELVRNTNARKQNTGDMLTGTKSKDNITGFGTKQRSTSRISEMFGSKRESSPRQNRISDVFSAKEEFTSPRQRSGQAQRDISESIGYSQRSWKASEIRMRSSPSPVMRTGRNTNKPTPMMISRNKNQYSTSSGNGTGVRTSDRSINPVINTSRTTGSPTWSNPTKSPSGSAISPSPRLNFGDLFSPSPSPSPGPKDKSKSPSPIPSPKTKSNSPSPSPSPKNKSPSPSPSPSPGPTNPIPTDSRDVPILIPRSQKARKTREIRNPNEIKRKKSDPQKSWRLAGLMNTDKLVSKTKVAGFVESVKSSYSVKRGGDIQDMVRKPKTKHR